MSRVLLLQFDQAPEDADQIEEEALCTFLTGNRVEMAMLRAIREEEGGNEDLEELGIQDDLPGAPISAGNGAAANVHNIPVEEQVLQDGPDEEL